MEQAPKKSRVGLYILLAVIGVIVAGGIAFLVLISNYMNSPEGKKLISGVSKTIEVTTAVVPVVDALRSYVRTKGDFPKSLDELSQFGASPGDIDTVKAVSVYKKPAKNAPDDTVVLKTNRTEFMQEAVTYIEVTKDLQARQVQVTPLEKRRRGRS